MIECPTCKISFSPSCRICPRCETYEPTLNERIEYLISAAEIALEEGAADADLESKLVQEGVSSQEAHEIVHERATKVRRATRYYGYKRLFGGIAMVFLAGFPFAAAIFGTTRRVTFTALGLMLAGMGVRLLVLGTRNILAGRD